MYELIQVSEQCYYINSPAKIGIYNPKGNDVYLIDSGNDKSAGKKVRQIIEKKNWNLLGILNTHSHADHIGGNQYLQNHTGCKVFSSGIEAAFTKYPELESAFLYGGHAPKDICHKFLCAAQSDVSDFSDPDFPKEVEIVPLSGHSFDMVGFKMPDGTAFIADAISSKATLEKYAVTFLYNVGAFLETLERLEALDAKVYVPAHVDVTEDISEVIAYNRQNVYEVGELLLGFCDEKPMIFEHILQRVFEHYEIKMTFEQNVLVGSTVKSYLSWLKNVGKLEVLFENNLLLWKTVK